MVVEVGARALTKQALNVHCGHDDFYGALDVGWTMMMARDAQHAACLLYTSPSPRDRG